mmetsp:Transcript_37042/g.72855  ORF Transcript_37042/g.72855 Transcript_37042/m.72855 type:complete len:337 (+) Transcript_37042:124-1134(+)
MRKSVACLSLPVCLVWGCSWTPTGSAAFQHLVFRKKRHNRARAGEPLNGFSKRQSRLRAVAVEPVGVFDLQLLVTDDEIEEASKAAEGTFDVSNSAAGEKIPLKVVQSTSGSRFRKEDIFAFGDGTHPTTRLCLEFLSALPSLTERGQQDLSLLDYGTGTGILTAAALRGRRFSKAVAVDIDAESLQLAELTFRVNGVSGDAELEHGRSVVVGLSESHDVCIANILPGPLTKLAPTLSSLVKPGGLLFLSGIRPWQVEDMRRRYGEWFHFPESSSDPVVDSLGGLSQDVPRLLEIFPEGWRASEHPVLGHWAGVFGVKKETDLSRDLDMFADSAVQ